MRDSAIFARAKIPLILCATGAVLLFFYGLGVFVSFYDTLKTKEGLKKDLFESVYSKSVFDRNGTLLSVFLNKQEQWHLKLPHAPPHKLRVAVLNYEDRRFYQHCGIDIFALLRSAKNNLTSHKRMGGSTISMQVVKLYTNAPRTFANKFNEIFQTLALESAYSKDEILNMYLNNAPYGGNIVGYHSAALLYFHKDSNALTWAESALLAVLPNAPGLLNLNKNTQILQQKRDTLLLKLHKKGYFDETILSLALKEPLPQTKTAYRNIAPHLSVHLARTQKAYNIHTTIDKNLQIRAESVIKQYHKKLYPQGILNIAALVVDTQSGEILSYVGSQDFLDIQNYGQIDGVRALRSPGSLLKPFLYALSIDNGLIAPQSLLTDVPLYFANFKPQNATKTYKGLVAAEYALQKSLNVPFVKLLQEYGYEKFFFTLQDMAHLPASNPHQYGLSFILGSKEINMLQIARLYRGLGNYGVFGELRFLANTQPKPMQRFLTKGSAYLTLQTLKELEREGILDFHKEKMVFSWKSGTSYGRKDAWAAGVSPKYTIVAWVGNFDAKPNPNILGVKTAGTLLFEILSALPDNNINFELPTEELEYIEVDKFSGYRLDDEYKNLLEKEDSQKSILYPIHAKPLERSPFYHKAFMYGDKEVDSHDSHFLESTPKLIIKLPLSVLNYYKIQNIQIDKHIQRHKKSVQILYPTQGLKILQAKDLDGDKELIINISNIKNQPISWYLNKKLVHSSAQSSFKTHLSPGDYHLTIVGEDGSMDSVSFYIKD
ncbi:penicillin-binding protein 1C [Helicobacter typhlonius]|uniref:penicillin-binding protein 1C n=1 Tax=Helicobacter typhlonius TaxID=76936 RepID=UPI002FE02E6F